MLIKQMIFLFVSIATLYANHIQWYGNYDNALKKAKDENKVLVVYLIKDDCKKCRETVKDIFTNQLYIDEWNKNFISVIVNNSSKQSYPREMYWSNAFPTIFFVDSKTETFIYHPLYHDTTVKEIKTALYSIKRTRKEP